MKKVLVVMLVIATLLLSVMPVMAASDIVLAVDYPETLPKAGEKFEVTVSIENNPKVYGVEFVLVFDKDKLTCTEMYAGELVAGAMYVTNPNANDGAKFAAVTLSGFSGDKVAAYCVFKAKEDIKEFDFSLDGVLVLDENTKNIAYGVRIGDGDVEELPEEEEPVAPSKPSAPEKPSAQTKPSVPDDDTPEDPETPDKDVAEEKPDVQGGTEDQSSEVVESTTFADDAAIAGWAKTYVNKAANQGLFKGDNLGNFNPNSPVTRAQFVTVLWRMAGKPEVTDETPFVDIQNQIPEFKSAIAWGYKNGYINGTSETTFAPDGTLTREAGMKILHLYSGGKSGSETLFEGIYDGIFKDSESIATWAKPSVYWGVYNKLISGTGADTLTPQGTATRAQLAKILVSYIESYQK